MLEKLFGGDDGDDADEDAGTGGGADGLFDDPVDGDLSGGDDPLDGGDGLMGGDASSGGGGDGASTDELANRIDDVEDEVASVSSSLETIESEHEGIRNAVDDVEENVRKLLEIYEMVTRGVNPFVDQAEPGGAGAGAESGSLGLFDGEEPADGAQSEDVPPETDANADGSPDDIDESESGAGEDAAAGDGESLDGEGDGQSFEELKSKYESGGDGGPGQEGVESVDDEDDVRSDDGNESDESPTGADVEEAGDPDAGSATSANGAEAGKPYLRELPAGYAAELVVLDWLEFLVDEAGVDGAAGTIAYYEAIDWLSAGAAESLQTYLQGFGEEVETDPEPRSWLTIEHHEASLRFVGRLADPSADALAFEAPLDRAPRGRPTVAEPAAPTPATNGADRRPGTATQWGQEPEVESDGGHPVGEGTGVGAPGALIPEAQRSVGDTVDQRSAGDTDDQRSAGDTDDQRSAEDTDDQRSAGDTEAEAGSEVSGEAGYGGFYWNHDRR